MLKILLTLIVGAIVFTFAATPVSAGTCSTGRYKTCVACCNTNPNIKNSPAQCRQQCGDYLIRKSSANR